MREALHVPATSNFFDGDNGAGMVYKSTEPDLRPFYQHVANSTTLRVIVYNGDTDPAINSFVAQAQIRTATRLDAYGCSLDVCIQLQPGCIRLQPGCIRLQSEDTWPQPRVRS